MLSQRSLGAAGKKDIPVDDEFNRVSFLSHFDGTNNGVNNVFDDSSSSNHTITANGNVTQGSFGPFARPDGEWAVSFDNSTAYARATGAGSFSGDYTYEVFVNVPFDDHTIRVTTNANGNLNALNIEEDGVSGTNNFVFGTSSTAGQTTTHFSDLEFSPNTWHHVALVRSGSTVKCYLDGTASSVTLSNSSATGAMEYIGTARGFTSGFRLFDGFMSNVRFSNIARYTSNFTPSTAPFVSDSNTNLLTCQSNRFVDNSSNGHTITPAGSAAVTAFGPFLTSSVYSAGVNGASGYFDGTGDWLTVPTSSDFNFGTGDFTISAWIYSETDKGIAILGDMDGNGNTDSYQLWWNNAADQIRLGTNNLNNMVGWSATLNLNSWNNVVVTRASGVIKFFFNGTEVSSRAVDSGDLDGATFNAPTPVYIGSFNDGGSDNDFTLDGYLTDVRVIKGTAVEPSGVPTAPLTAVTNTKLLLNMADGQAIDSAAHNNLTLVGTAKTSTAQSKFGGASLLLDGNSDYANFPEAGANDIDGSGDWTVEFFWRFNNNTSPIYQMLLTKGFGLQIYTINGALAIALSDNNSGTYFISTTGGTTLSNDTWHHVALVKNGTSYKVYLDGTHETNLGGTSSSTVGTGGGSWHIGAIETAELTYPANGYMDEVRISKTARYVNNFTAPTEPFADKGQ